MRRRGSRSRTARDALGEGAVVDEHLGVGVVEQVAQLVREVAVVHVHRHGAQLHRREGGLEELVAVVEVHRHLRAAADAVRRERRGQPRGALVEITIRNALLPVDERHLLREAVGDGFPQAGQIHVGLLLAVGSDSVRIGQESQTPRISPGRLLKPFRKTRGQARKSYNFSEILPEIGYDPG